jgi:hypothetical protein
MAKSKSAPRSTTKTRRPRETAVRVPVDTKLRAAWKEQFARLERASREGAGAFDERYESAAAILEHNPPLYLAGGCATFRAFCEEYMHEDERSVRRNIRVAKYATPAQEQRHGTSKIDAALNYIEAKLGHPVEGALPVDLDRLKFDDGDARVSFADATTQQIQAATRALHRKGAKKKSASPVMTAFAKVLSGKKLATISVRVSGDHVSLGHIPIAAVADVARALAKVKIPAAATSE